MNTPTNPLMALAALVMGAGTATAAAPDAAIGEPLTAGIGGLLGYGVHLVGRAVRDWIAADAAARRQTAETMAELRELMRDLRAHFEASK